MAKVSESRRGPGKGEIPTRQRGSLGACIPRIGQALALLILPGLSAAALGTRPASDFQGTMSPLVRPAAAAPSGPGFRVVRTTLASQTVVSEFVDATGQVFAISWSGPFQPDLKQLLGPHFGKLREAKVATRTHLQLAAGDVRIESAGRAGAFRGRAWIPAQLPAGFDPKVLL